jgi:ribosomal protein L20
MLSEIAINDNDAFKNLVEIAKKEKGRKKVILKQIQSKRLNPKRTIKQSRKSTVVELKI